MAVQTVSITIYFLRHGETEASRTGTYCGTLDPDLTAEGKLMAEDFAEAYAPLSWNAVYASPLTRTVRTARPLCERLGLEMRFREDLREIAYGSWEGKTPDEVNREFHDDYIRWLSDPGWNAPSGGERGIDIARRSSSVLEELETSTGGGNMLIVSHKATIRIMLCLLLGIDIGRFRDRISVPAGSVSIVEMTERGPLLRISADMSHLRKELRSREGG